MRTYADLLGQEHIITHLRTAVRTGRVSHACIFEGTGHTEKLWMAESFAAALQCETKSGDPCGKCRSCRQAAGRNQPDILYVTHEKPKTISVNDIREQINGSIFIRPYSSPYKVYIIDEAHLMNVQAQNALLKTLEEPPAYAVLLLLTENVEVFLPTIRSRCVTLHFRPVADEKIRDFLMQEHGIPDYQADLCTAFAQGDVGKAVRLASSTQFHELREQMVRQMSGLGESSLFSLADSVSALGDLKANAEEYLKLLQCWFRDVLLFKASGRTDKLIFSDAAAVIRRQAAAFSWRGLSGGLQAIREARARIRANVSAELTVEWMLIGIRDALLDR